MNNDITSLCERLRAALEGVTPGPWRNGADASHFDAPEVTDFKTFSYYVHNDRDAAFIALSREAAPALLDALERLSSENATLTDEIDKIADQAFAADDRATKAAAEIERLREGLGDILNIAGGDIISVRVKKRARAALTGED